jgi:hypothetical protein
MKREISLPLLKKAWVHNGESNIIFDFNDLDETEKVLDKFNKNYSFAKSILNNTDILNNDNIKSKTNCMFIKDDNNIELKFNISNKDTIYSIIPLKNVQFLDDTDTITIKGNLNENKNDYILSAILPSKYNYNEIVISKHN